MPTYPSFDAKGRLGFTDTPTMKYRQQGEGVTPTTNANLALTVSTSGQIAPAFLKGVVTGAAQILVNANSLTLIWPTTSAFVMYAVMRQRGGREFYLRDFVGVGTYTDQTLPDGEAANYRVFGISNSATWTLIATLGSAQQPRTYKSPVTLSQGQAITGNYASADPSVPAIIIPAGVTNYSVTNARVKHAGDGILANSGSDGLISNLIGFGVHPGVANSSHGKLINAQKPAGITVEYVDSEAASFVLYVNGQSTSSVQRIVLRKWRATGMQCLKTNANGTYQLVRGAVGHAFQADHCFSVPVYDVEDGEVLTEPGVGLIEDPINNYVSSGLSTRKYNIRRLCIFGLWPITKGADPNTDPGFNAGCGIISDGAQPDSDDSKHGNGLITQNLLLATGNAGIGVGNGNDQEVSFNKVVCSGQYPDGTVNRGTNVGIYVNAYSGGTVKRTYLHDNQSMCWDRPGSRNKNPGDGYNYNNAYDVGGTDTVVGSGATANTTLGGMDASAAVAKYAQEVLEHNAWHAARYQAGTVIGAVSANLS